MIDTKELRSMVNGAQFESFANSVINSLLDRIEAAEKERDALRAKIEAMERQERVAVVENDYNADGLSARISEYLPAGMTLYTLPGAQPAPSIPPELEPNGMYDGSHHYASGWNDCRAAMLEAQPEDKS